MKRSKLKLTAETMEKIFGLEPGSITGLSYNQDTRIIHVYNTDSNIGYDLAEGQEVPAILPVDVEERLRALLLSFIHNTKYI